MKLVKTAIATFLATSFAASAADVTVYGKANVSFQSSDEGAGSFTELKSNASRFGIKGDLKLENDLTVVYKYEVQIDLTDEANEDNLKSRNQYVGLKGNFGEILLGRNDTVLKQAQGKIDLFNDYEGDLKRVWKGENRMSDSLTYKTPMFGQFQFGASYIVEDSPTGQDGYSVALTYGDSSLKKGDFYGSIAADKDVKGYNAARIIGHFKLAGFKIGVGLHNQEKAATGEDADGYLLNAAYGLDKTTFKVQYQTLEDNDIINLGVDYKLGSKTKLFAWYASYDQVAGNDGDYVAAGIEHKF